MKVSLPNASSHLWVIALSLALCHCGFAIPGQNGPASNGNGGAAGAGSQAQLVPNPGTTLAGTILPYTNLDFHDQPADDRKALAFTFDDGPDGSLGNTTHLLDALKAANIKGTFFINSDNWTNIAQSPEAQESVRRMAAEGHTIANHSASHPHFVSLDTQGIDAELTGVETAVAQALGKPYPVTLIRAPYGAPYQADVANTPAVAAAVMPHGVHIGWSVDANDWLCKAGEVRCVVDNLTASLNKGHWGIVLMHATYRATGDAMVEVVREVTARGYHIVSVEDLVRLKYGKSSAEVTADPNSVLYDENGTAADNPTPATPDAPSDPNAPTGQPTGPTGKPPT